MINKEEKISAMSVQSKHAWHMTCIYSLDNDMVAPLFTFYLGITLSQCMQLFYMTTVPLIFTTFHLCLQFSKSTQRAVTSTKNNPTDLNNQAHENSLTSR